MPRVLLWPQAQQDLDALTPRCRRGALDLLMDLGAGLPLDAVPIKGIPDAYRATAQDVVISYRFVADEVDVYTIRPNS